MAEKYTKKATLKDGTEITLRPMVAEDKQRLYEFFANLPEEDRMFLKHDVTDHEVIDRWIKDLDYDRVLPVLALENDKIVGDATLHFNRYGWQRHIGEIRVVVAKDYQQKGLGTLLASELFYIALKKGLDKIQALMMEDQVGAVKAFARLGFRKEAVLKDGVVDLHGRKHNLVIMTNHVSALWDKMHDLMGEMDFPIQDRIS